MPNTPALVQAGEVRLAPLIRESSEATAKGLAERFRVACLATAPTHPLMWSHYAEKHHGVCLEFGTDNVHFDGALKVEYLDEYPVFELADNDDSKALRYMTTKAKVWEYEDEFRLIAQEKAFAIGETLIAENNFCRIPDTALKSIIVGCSMLAAERDTLRKILRGSKVGLSEAVKMRNRYELQIVASSNG